MVCIAAHAKADDLRINARVTPARVLEILSEAMVGVEPDLAAGVCRVLSHVWFSALIGWVNGWENGADVGEELEVAARLLLRGP